MTQKTELTIVQVLFVISMCVNIGYFFLVLTEHRNCKETPNNSEFFRGTKVKQ